MLHSLPALLDQLEGFLIQGQDPLPLLAQIRWKDVVDWPKDLKEARKLQNRLMAIQALINGLHAPNHAALTRLGQSVSYGVAGRLDEPKGLSLRFSSQV